MTPKMLETMEEKVSKAKELQRRIAQLTEAVDMLNAGTIVRLVCWSDTEAGLGAEIFSATVAALQKRLQAARDEYEKL